MLKKMSDIWNIIVFRCCRWVCGAICLAIKTEDKVMQQSELVCQEMGRNRVTARVVDNYILIFDSSPLLLRIMEMLWVPIGI